MKRKPVCVYILAVGSFMTVCITTRILLRTNSTSDTKNYISPFLHVKSEKIDSENVSKPGRFYSVRTHFSTGTSTTFSSADWHTTDSYSVKSESQLIHCVEKRHVVFIKVHKAGSSTVTNVLIRFGVSRNLSFALPRKGVIISLSQLQGLGNLMEPPNGLPYDILCNHAVYNRQEMKQIMHRDTMYFGIVRDPISLVNSAIYYFFKKVIPGKNKLKQYVNNPRVLPSRRLVNNSMAYEFGLPPENFMDTEKINSHLKKIDKEFSVIIVMESMPESLLLIRRQMCWSLRDILYIPRNANTQKPDLNITKEETKTLKEMLKADMKLYAFSVQRLSRQIIHEGQDFQNELRVYKSMLNKLGQYCSGPASDDGSKLTIFKTNWSETFSINRQFCDKLNFNGFQILKYAKQYQYKNVK